jgi:HPt (histidine-containing phosphotransfer) domain-containing protein
MKSSDLNNFGNPISQSFEKEALLSRCGNKNELVKKLINIVLEDIPKQIEKLDRALHEHNTVEIYQVAHKIKGTSLNLCFPMLKDAAEKLEKTSRISTSITETIEKLVVQLKNEWDILLPLLLEF